MSTEGISGAGLTRSTGAPLLVEGVVSYAEPTNCKEGRRLRAHNHRANATWGG